MRSQLMTLPRYCICTYGGLGTGSEDIYLYLLDVTQSDTTIMSGEVTPTISTSSTTCDSASGYAFQISGSTFNIHSGDELELIITNDNTLEDFGVCFGGTTASYITIDPTNVQTVTSTSTVTTTTTATSVSTVISTSIPPPVTTTATSTVTQTDLSTVTTTEPAVTTTVTSVSTATSTQTIQPTLTIEAKNAMGDPITGQSITVNGPGTTSPVTTDGSGEYEFSSGLTEGASYTASTVIDDVTLSGTVTLGGNSVILLEPTAPSIPTPEFPVGALSILIPLLALAAFFAIRDPITAAVDQKSAMGSISVSDFTKKRRFQTSGSLAYTLARYFAQSKPRRYLPSRS